MTIFGQIKADLKSEMKAKDVSRRDNLKVILAELQRISAQEVEDKDALKVLKKLSNNEREVLSKTGKDTSDYLELVDSYLPAQTSEAEIKKFISDSIDLAKFPNRAPIIGMIMKHFKGNADGNMVKDIVNSL